jgi:hypothetical protein
MKEGSPDEETRINDLYNHPLAVRRVLGELKADILMIHRDMKDLFLVEGEEEISRILQSIEGVQAGRPEAVRGSP